MTKPLPWSGRIALLLLLPAALLPLTFAEQRSSAPVRPAQVHASRFHDWTTHHAVYGHAGTIQALEAARTGPRAIFRWREIQQQSQLAQRVAQQRQLQSHQIDPSGVSMNEIRELESTGLAAKRKRPYQKRDFQYEKVFETMALACGKLSTTQRQCPFNRKNS